MLRKLFGIDSSFTNIMGKFADVVLLSTLWVVCSLPLITVVVSTSAFYYAVVKSIRKERGTPCKEYLKFFRENFKQGMVLGLLWLLLGGLAAANIYAVSEMDKATVLYSVYKAESLWVLILFVFLSLFLFPVFSRFEYRAWDCIKTSLFIAVRHTLSSVLLAIVLLGAGFAAVRYPVLLFFLPAYAVMLCSLRIEKILRKYMKRPEEGEAIPWYWEDSTALVQDDEKKENKKK